MNNDIREIATWARANGWTVEDDTSGYTRFFDSTGNYVVFTVTATNAGGTGAPSTASCGAVVARALSFHCALKRARHGL